MTFTFHDSRFTIGVPGHLSQSFAAPREHDTGRSPINRKSQIANRKSGATQW
jgi:hypothetical protein